MRATALDCRFTAPSPLPSRTDLAQRRPCPAAAASGRRQRRFALHAERSDCPRSSRSSAALPARPRPMPRADQFIFYALGASIAGSRGAAGDPLPPFDPRSSQGPHAAARSRAGQREDEGEADQGRCPGAGQSRRRRQHRADRRAKTPLPVLPKASATGEIAVATQRLDELEQQARELMTRIKGAPPAAYAMPKPAEAPEPVGAAVGERADAAHARSDAARGADREGHGGYQKRPKRRFVGARAEEYRLRALRRGLARSRSSASATSTIPRRRAS